MRSNFLDALNPKPQFEISSFPNKSTMKFQVQFYNTDLQEVFSEDCSKLFVAINAFPTGTLQLGWTHSPQQFSSQNRATLFFLSMMMLLWGWPQKVPTLPGVCHCQGDFFMYQNPCHQPLWKHFDRSVSCWWTSALAPPLCRDCTTFTLIVRWSTTTI